MFKVGDLAVYPTQGVGIVEAIEVREFSGENHDFYVLRMVDSDMKIMIPVSNAKVVGMRCLIAKDRVDSIYDILGKRSPKSPALASWSRRQREYHEKIKSGDLLEVASVFKELHLIKEGKELSYGEKKVLDLARKLLVKEIALAEGADEELVFQRIEKIFLH